MTRILPLQPQFKENLLTITLLSQISLDYRIAFRPSNAIATSPRGHSQGMYPAQPLT